MNLGFIDHYIDEWHANQYPEFIRKASDGKITVTHAYAQIDSPSGGRPLAVWAQETGIIPAQSIEEVIDACDGLVVLAPDNTEQHEALAQLPLRSGKPVFIDKTFSPDTASARRLFSIAKEHNTPLFSSSALRFAEEYEPLKQLDISALHTMGPGGFSKYSVHQLEPILMLISSAPKRVLAVEHASWITLLIEFNDGRLATMVITGTGDAPFAVTATAKDSTYVTTASGDFFSHFSVALSQFFLQGTVPVAPEQTIAIMALRQAGLVALASPGTWQPVE